MSVVRVNDWRLPEPPAICQAAKLIAQFDVPIPRITKVFPEIVLGTAAKVIGPNGRHVGAWVCGLNSCVLQRKPVLPLRVIHGIESTTFFSRSFRPHPVRVARYSQSSSLYRTVGRSTAVSCRAQTLCVA